MTLRLITAADNSDVVTLSEAKSHCRISTSSEDSLIEIYLAAAIEFAKNFANIAFLEETWRLSLETFPFCDEITLDRTPFFSLVSFQYYNSSGGWTSVDSSIYELDEESIPAKLRLRSGRTWPNPALGSYAARVDFVAGFSDATLIPSQIKNAILCLVAYLYEHRGDDDSSVSQMISSGTAARLIWPIRQLRFS